MILPEVYNAPLCWTLSDANWLKSDVWEGVKSEFELKSEYKTYAFSLVTEFSVLHWHASILAEVVFTTYLCKF